MTEIGTIRTRGSEGEGGMGKGRKDETVHAPPDLLEGPAALDRTTELLRRALRVPKAEMATREKAWKRDRIKR